MEEEEKLEIRQHLIKWVDTFLKDGIVPKVVNPKAIKANYILKSKVKEKIEELNDISYAEELEDIMNRENYTITELIQYVLKELLDCNDTNVGSI